MEHPQQYRFRRLLVLLLAAALFSPVAHGLPAHIAQPADFAEALQLMTHAGPLEGAQTDCLLCLSSSHLRTALDHGVDEGLQLASHPGAANAIPIASAPHVRVSAGGPRAPPNFF